MVAFSLAPLQINIFTAFLCALKATAQIKGSLGKDKVVDVGSQLVMSVLTNEDVILRCAAAEALGRMAQVVGGNFAQSMIQHCVTALQKERKCVFWRREKRGRGNTVCITPCVDHIIVLLNFQRRGPNGLFSGLGLYPSLCWRHGCQQALTEHRRVCD